MITLYIPTETVHQASQELKALFPKEEEIIDDGGNVFVSVKNTACGCQIKILRVQATYAQVHIPPTPENSLIIAVARARGWEDPKLTAKFEEEEQNQGLVSDYEAYREIRRLKHQINSKVEYRI